MTLSILADDEETTLEPSVVGENADKSIKDPGHRADAEHPETVEYLFIGTPPGSSRRHVQHAAGLGTEFRVMQGRQEAGIHDGRILSPYYSLG
jgi:hypothetical protein